MYSRSRSIAAAVAVAAVAAGACRPPAETAEQAEARIMAESQAARTAIEAKLAGFVRHFNAGNLDSMVLAYAPEAVVMAPGKPAVTGREAILAQMQADRAMMQGGTFALHVVSVSANGPLAVERGTWSFSFPAQGRNPAMTMTGKYLAHWHNIGGEWLMVEDIWNDDAPPPPPAPAPRR
jgi:ketosteroid isomerase-like protein